jgi:hypothetical protein
MRLVSLPALVLVCAAASGCGRASLEPAALAGPALPVAAAQPARAGAARGDDYLDAELRREVEALRTAIESRPSTAGNCAERARVVWRWANALALTGRPVSQESVAMLAGVSAAEARGEPCGDRILRDLDGEIRELALRDREPDAFGTARFTPPAEPLRAASYVTVEQTYTVGTRPITTGGALLLGNQIMADQGHIQNRDPAAPAYVSARASNASVAFERTVHPLGGRHGGFKGPKDMPVFRVAKGTLAPGDSVTFVYGDRSGGSNGLLLQSMSTDNLLLPIYVDLDGSGRYYAIAWPELRVTGTTGVDAVSAVAPSVVDAGESFALAVRTEDRYRNRTEGAVPGYEVRLGGRKVASLASGADALSIVRLRIDEPGVHRVEVRSEDGALEATSNPIWVEQGPERRVFWGELHGHSGYAEGQGAADQFFAYARDDARLDFVSLTDHDTNLDDFEWNLLRERTAHYGRDGELVTFLGYEFSLPRDNGGHHNVFFRTPDGRRRVPRQEAPSLDTFYPRVQRENRAEDVLVVPHAHTAANWNQSDSEVERLVEIASMHGTFEWFGNLYLRNGFEIGFIAASDDHRSKPGLAPGLFFAPQLQPGGLAAAVAPEKTADAIFDALRGLSAYATSGERILLDTRLNGEPMGTRQASNAKRRIEARTSGTAPIDRLDVVKNGEVVWSERYLGAPLLSHSWVQVAFESSSEVAAGPVDNPREYRVWSGTLDVDGAELVGLRTTGLRNAYVEWARIDPDRPNRVRFYTETRGKAESILIELEGASAATELSFDLVAARESGFGQGIRKLAEIPAAQVTLELSALEDSRIEHPLPVGPHQDRLLVQVVDPTGALDRELQFEDLGDARDGDYYYVRVTQLDGSQAWSTPFWVGPAPKTPATGAGR